MHIPTRLVSAFAAAALSACLLPAPAYAMPHATRSPVALSQQPLAEFEDLKIATNAESISLTWDAIPHATNYLVRYSRNANMAGATQRTVKQPKLVLEDIKLQQTYYITLTARGAGYADRVSVVVTAETLPPRSGGTTKRVEHTLAGRVKATADHKVVKLANADYIFRNFSDNLNGYVLGTRVSGIHGTGKNSSVIKMVSHTSTHAKDVPTKSGTTNQLTLLKINGGSPELSDFTLLGTSQGHRYNGLRIASTRSAKISDVVVKNANPGSSDVPPGETFGINDYRTKNSHYSDIEVVGSNAGGSLLGTNNSDNVTVDGAYLHGSVHAHGAAFWQTHNLKLIDVKSVDNKDAGLNFERVSGTVNIVRPVTRDNDLADIRIGNDKGSATYNIYDPVYSGTKLTILVPSKYFKVKNLQKRSQIHVYKNGRDVTSQVVRWKSR